MRAVVIPEPGQVAVTDVPDPALLAGQVLVAVDRCGLCGTDRHLLAGDNPFARYPAIPGHEFAGHIVELGSGVDRLRVGQLVAVDPSYFCRRCEQCRAGYPNLCPYKGGYGSRLPGGAAELVAVDDESCEPMPDGTDPSVAALTEPLACVLHGMDNLGPVLGDRAVVYGAGPIGLMSVALLARAGVRDLAVVEPNPARQKAALAFGATEVADSGDALSSPAGFEVVVDATGNPVAMADGMARIRSGGRFLILGVAAQSARLEISPFEVNWRELRIIGSMAVRHSFGRAARLLESSFFDAGSLVSDVVPLESFEAVLAELGSGGQLKVQVSPHLSLRDGVPA